MELMHQMLKSIQIKMKNVQTLKNLKSILYTYNLKIFKIVW